MATSKNAYLAKILQLFKLIIESKDRAFYTSLNSSQNLTNNECLTSKCLVE